MISKDTTHHIGVVAFPLGTHGTPLLNTIRCLASLAPPNVKFSFFSTKPSLNLLFPNGENINVGYPNIRPYEIGDGKPKLGHGEVFKGTPMEEVELFMKAAPGSLREVIAEAEVEVGEKMRCLIGDVFLGSFLGDLAQEFGVPWVACWISGVHSITIHVYTDVIREQFGFEGAKDETLDSIPGLSKIRIQDIPDCVLAEDNGTILSHMLEQTGRVLTRASAVCINCCEEMDQVLIQDLRSKFSNVYPLGPMGLVVSPPNGLDKYNCLAWLDEQPANSVVYVGFGSAAMPYPSELVALAEALEESGLKFLWSLKDQLKVYLPKGFLEKNKEKGMVVPWAPQIEVLAHEAVGVFITHFGYGSITESIAAGTPMIGRPFFGDHKLNGRLVEVVWEIGLQVQGEIFTKDGVLQSLNRILSYDEGEKIKMNIRNLSEVFSKAVSPNGSSIENFKKLLELVTTV